MDIFDILAFVAAFFLGYRSWTRNATLSTLDIYDIIYIISIIYIIFYGLSDLLT